MNGWSEQGVSTGRRLDEAAAQPRVHACENAARWAESLKSTVMTAEVRHDPRLARLLSWEAVTQYGFDTVSRLAPSRD